MQADKRSVNQLRALAAHINIVDCLIVLVFALYALLFFLGRWQGQKPFVFLHGDTAHIASFAAAFDYPQNFINDAFLSDTANFRWYMTIHIPILRVLKPIVGDYGTAFIYQLGFHIFFQLTGFYLFGRLMFKNRYWALLLAVMTLATLWSPGLADYWGVFDDPQPRFSFQVFLPYLLSGVIVWRNDMVKWPILMVAAGLLMYVHPASAPVWGFSLWLGLWLFTPEAYSPKKQVGYMFLLGLIFLITTAPYVATYLSLRDPGTVGNYAQISDLMRSTYGAYMNIPETFTLYLKTYVVYICLALLGAGIVAILEYKNRKIFWLTLVWLFGILLVSIVGSTIDYQISAARRSMPLQFNLIRGIRFIAPFMILYWLWGLNLILSLPQGFRRAHTIITILGTFALLFLYREPLKTLLPRPQQALSCWFSGQWTCTIPEGDRQITMDMIDILEAVERDTPAGTRILPLVNEAVNLGVRYYSLRPVVFAAKDSGILSFSNTAEFLRRNELRLAYDAIYQEPAGPLNFQKIVEFANKLHAERVIIFNFGLPSEYLQEETIVYQNQSYILLDLDP